MKGGTNSPTQNNTNNNNKLNNIRITLSSPTVNQEIFKRVTRVIENDKTKRQRKDALRSSTQQFQRMRERSLDKT